MLRIAYAVGAVAHLLHVAQYYLFNSPAAAAMLPFDITNVFGWCVAFAYTFSPGFARRWKLVTLGMCMLMVSGWTCGTVRLGSQTLLFSSILLLLMATCALVPWELRWQAVLSGWCLAAAGVSTFAIHPSVPDLSTLWLHLLVGTVVGLTSNRAWARWRVALVQTCDRLRDSEAQVRKMIDSSLDQVALVRLRDGRYAYVNDEFLKRGYTREQVIGKSVDELGMWPDLSQFEEFGRRLRAEGFIRNQEGDVRMADGRVVPYLISSILVELLGEVYVLSTARDISELKKIHNELIATREAALAASRAKSEFLSSMSHEIRTPMNAILGMADLLGETPLNPEQRRFVETMTNNGNALLELINGILDLAKIESTRLHLEKDEFGLDEVVDRVIDTLGVRAHEKKIELAARILPDVPLGLVGDQLRLRQILINLIGNAIKFTERGEVVLTVEKAADESGLLHFMVRDSGIGIPAEKLGAIFDSFTQADSSTTRKYGGSGLGLAIAKRLVELMGGRMWAESSPGEGSTFHFTARFGVHPGIPERDSSDGLKLAGTRVLVVDDNDTNRLILREILSRKGADVAEAENGENALLEWRRAKDVGTPYKLVLLDCRMPGMDGFEVARRLQNESSGAGPITLMLTSDDLNPNLSQLKELGLSAYLVKPIKRADLFRAVAVAMGVTKAGDEKTTQNRSDGAAADRRLSILLAEDSRDNRMLITQYVKNLPYDLELAENGEIAVGRFERGRYDLVLMDMQMPVMDGYTAVRKIREWEREQGRASTMIIALTASALETDVRNCMEAGCNAHLSKPVKKANLLRAIRELTAREADGADANADNSAAHSDHIRSQNS